MDQVGGQIRVVFHRNGAVVCQFTNAYSASTPKLVDIIAGTNTVVDGTVSYLGLIDDLFLEHC